MINIIAEEFYLFQTEVKKNIPEKNIPEKQQHACFTSYCATETEIIANSCLQTTMLIF